MIAVPLQAVQSVLDRLLNRLLNVFAHFVNLVDASDRLVRVGDVDGWHVKASPVQSRSLAQFLTNQISTPPRKHVQKLPEQFAS